MIAMISFGLKRTTEHILIFNGFLLIISIELLFYGLLISISTNTVIPLIICSEYFESLIIQ